MIDGHDHTDNGGHDGHEHGVSPDAGHMLTDAAAIGLSLVALRLAQRPAKGVWTFGFKRGAGELGLISRAGAALRSRFGEDQASGRLARDLCSCVSSGTAPSCSRDAPV